MSNREFYKELGKLLYAISNADGMIHEKDRSQILKIMYEELGEDHAKGQITPDAWETEKQLEHLEEYDGDVETAFNDFLNYFDENKGEISSELRDKCMRIASRIAREFHAGNYYERFYLKKLRQHLFSKSKSAPLVAEEELV